MRPPHQPPGTTGLAYFTECQRHSAKAGKHSAKKSPSVALGEAHMVFLLPAKTAMPSAFSRALSKFLPCATPHSAKNETGRPNGRTERMGRDGSGTSPSAGLVALSKDPKFAECQIYNTRRSFDLHRVPRFWHSAKFGSSPSATRLALGEVSNFAECLGNYTRQICFPGNRKMVALPSVRVKTLGKACCFFVFFLFFMY